MMQPVAMSSGTLFSGRFDRRDSDAAWRRADDAFDASDRAFRAGDTRRGWELHHEGFAHQRDMFHALHREMDRDFDGERDDFWD